MTVNDQGIFISTCNRQYKNAGLPDIMRHYRIWKKQHVDNHPNEEIEQSITKYIQKVIPCDGEVPVRLLMKILALTNASKFVEKAKSIYPSLRYTIAGQVISLNDMDVIICVANNYISLTQLITSLWPSTPPNKYNVNSIVKYVRAKTDFIFEITYISDDYDEKYYLPNNKEDSVRRLVEDGICIINHSEDMININNYPNYVTVEQTAALFKIDKLTLIDKIKLFDTKKIGVFYLVSKSSICKMTEVYNRFSLIEPLVAEIIKDYGFTISKAIKIVTDAGLESKYSDIIVNHKKLPIKKTNCLFYNTLSRTKVEEILRDLIEINTKYTVEKVASKLNTKQSIIKKHCESGLIKCDGENMITHAELNRHIIDKRDWMGLADAVITVAERTQSLYNHKTVQNRRELMHFLENNHIFGVKHRAADTIGFEDTSYSCVYILKSDVPQLQRHLILWLKGFGRTPEEKTNILIDHFRPKYPKLCNILADYITAGEQKTKRESPQAMLNLSDYLFSMHSDISSDREAIACMVDNALPVLPKITYKMLCDLLVKNRYISGDVLTLNETTIHMETSAYRLEQFSTMFYLALSEKSISDHNLIKKAIENRKFAMTWVFVLTLFFGAWRGTDISGLSAPKLPYDTSTILEKIISNNWLKQDSEYVVTDYLFEVQNFDVFPNKSLRHNDIPRLIIHVPESCKYVYGLALAIAAVHFYRSDDDQFISPVNDAATLGSFFGEDFVFACEGKGLYIRRANKALLQGIETGANEGKENKSFGYILASLARSHKGSIASLAKTTAIYLSDANFAGNDADFIILQLMERGVCSFVVAKMLEVCFGKEYKLLPETSKTQLQLASGLTAYESDAIMRARKIAQRRADQVVCEILKHNVSIKDALYLISTHDNRSLGKDTNSYCLLRAIGMECSDISRKSCLGCAYEVLTKASLQKIVSEYRRLYELGITSENNVAKFSYLANNILPLIAEIASFMKTYSNSSELDHFRIIISRGLPA